MKYTHVEKGGAYTIVDKAKTAGELKDTCDNVVVYKDGEGRLFVRTLQSFNVAMSELSVEPPSDLLRAELTANNIEMNRLTERNDTILSALRERGLEPVRVRETPLTRQEIHARDWFCKDGSAECRRVLFHLYGYAARTIEIYEGAGAQLNKREIIRKGNEFYYA